MLHGLLLTQWMARREFALHGVRAHQPERALADAEPPHAVMHPAGPESLLRERETLTLGAYPVRDRHAHALEPQLAVAGVAASRVAHHGDVAHEREAGRVHRNDDLAFALVRLGVPRGDGHDDRERRAIRARGEPLVTVDHVLVALAARGGGKPDRVRARELRLGHRETAADLAARERLQPFRFLSDTSMSMEQLAVADVRRLRVEQVVADRRLAQQGGDVREFRERQATAAQRDRKVRRPQPAPLHFPAQFAQPRLDLTIWKREIRALQRKSTLVQKRTDVGEKFLHRHPLLPCRAGLVYDLLDLPHELRAVVRNAVLDYPLGAERADFLAVADGACAARVQHLDVLERVAVHDDEVGGPADPHVAELVFLAEYLRVVAGAVLDDLERIEAGFLVEFHLADEAEAVHLVDETRVVAAADGAALAFEVAERGHPYMVVLLPVRFVGAAPADEVRSVVCGIGLEVVLERGMEVVLEPGLGLRALEVTARFIDVERRHPGDVGAHHRGEHGVEQLGVGLAPEPARPAEAVGLVEVVVFARKVLAAVGNGGVGNAVPVLDAGGAELDVVPRVGLFDADVVRDAQPDLVRLVFHGLHDVALDAEDLDAVGAELLERLHAGAGLGGRMDGDAAIEHRVREDARRDDLATPRLVAEFDDAGVGFGADLADGGDAAGEPELEVVVVAAERLAGAVALEVRVRVDETGEDELAGRVDLDVTGGSPGVTPVHRDRIERHDIRDRVPDDDDVERAAGRRAVAVDDGGVADHEPRWALAVGDALGLGGEGRSGGRRECGGRPEKSGEEHRSAPAFHWCDGSRNVIPGAGWALPQKAES